MAKHVITTKGDAAEDNGAKKVQWVFPSHTLITQQLDTWLIKQNWISKIWAEPEKKGERVNKLCFAVSLALKKLCWFI